MRSYAALAQSRLWCSVARSVNGAYGGRNTDTRGGPTEIYYYSERHMRSHAVCDAFQIRIVSIHAILSGYTCAADLCSVHSTYTHTHTLHTVRHRTPHIACPGDMGCQIMWAKVIITKVLPDFLHCARCAPCLRVA